MILVIIVWAMLAAVPIQLSAQSPNPFAPTQPTPSALNPFGGVAPAQPAAGGGAFPAFPGGAAPAPGGTTGPFGQPAPAAPGAPAAGPFGGAQPAPGGVFPGFPGGASPAPGAAPVPFGQPAPAAPGAPAAGPFGGAQPAPGGVFPAFPGGGQLGVAPAPGPFGALSPPVGGAAPGPFGGGALGAPGVAATPTPAANEIPAGTTAEVYEAQKEERMREIRAADREGRWSDVVQLTERYLEFDQSSLNASTVRSYRREAIRRLQPDNQNPAGIWGPSGSGAGSAAIVPATNPASFDAGLVAPPDPALSAPVASVGDSGGSSGPSSSNILFYGGIGLLVIVVVGFVVVTIRTRREEAEAEAELAALGVMGGVAPGGIAMTPPLRSDVTKRGRRNVSESEMPTQQLDLPEEEEPVASQPPPAAKGKKRAAPAAAPVAAVEVPIATPPAKAAAAPAPPPEPPAPPPPPPAPADPRQAFEALSQASSLGIVDDIDLAGEVRFDASSLKRAGGGKEEAAMDIHEMSTRLEADQAAMLNPPPVPDSAINLGALNFGGDSSQGAAPARAAAPAPGASATTGGGDFTFSSLFTKEEAPAAQAPASPAPASPGGGGFGGFGGGAAAGGGLLAGLDFVATAGSPAASAPASASGGLDFGGLDLGGLGNMGTPAQGATSSAPNFGGLFEDTALKKDGGASTAKAASPAGAPFASPFGGGPGLGSPMASVAPAPAGGGDGTLSDIFSSNTGFETPSAPPPAAAKAPVAKPAAAPKPAAAAAAAQAAAIGSLLGGLPGLTDQAKGGMDLTTGSVAAPQPAAKPAAQPSAAPPSPVSGKPLESVLFSEETISANIPPKSAPAPMVNQRPAPAFDATIGLAPTSPGGAGSGRPGLLDDMPLGADAATAMAPPPAGGIDLSGLDATIGLRSTPAANIGSKAVAPAGALDATMAIGGAAASAPAPAKISDAELKQRQATRSKALFEEQRKKGNSAAQKGDWKQAVHFYGIAAALDPSNEDIKKALTHARNMRKMQSSTSIES